MTPRQQRFVSAYVGEAKFNATKAAEIAGYAQPRQRGCELKSEPEIAAAIKEHLDAAAMSADEVLMRLADQARADISDFITFEQTGEYWRVDLAKAARAGKLHLLKSITFERMGQKIEMVDAQAALVHLGRHHKLFTDKVEQHDPETDAKIERLLAELGAAREEEAPGEAGGDIPE